MSKAWLLGVLAFGLAACGAAAGKEEVGGTVVRTRFTLASGRRIEATIQDSLSSRRNTVGETLRATVSTDVKDAQGYIAIPAGSAVTLRVMQLAPATNKSQTDGKLALTVSTVTVRGQVYDVNAPVASTPHVLVGRGVTAGEVEKAGGGAVIGAVAGRVIGGDTKGAVIGGVVGGATGTAVAIHYASRDVVVTPGTRIVFALGQSLTVSAR